MQVKKVRERFPVSTAVKPDLYRRLVELRRRGWKITQIFKAGIESAEKKS